MIYTHVLKSSAAGTASPLDQLMMTSARVDRRGDPSRRSRDDSGDNDNHDDKHNDDSSDDGAGRRDASWRAREPFPCYLATPSFTAAATSAS